MNPRILRPLLCLLLLGALAPLAPAREKIPPEDLEIVEKKWPETKRTYTGLRYIILEPGDAKGPTPGSGAMGLISPGAWAWAVAATSSGIAIARSFMGS